MGFNHWSALLVCLKFVSHHWWTISSKSQDSFYSCVFSFLYWTEWCHLDDFGRNVFLHRACIEHGTAFHILNKILNLRHAKFCNEQLHQISFRIWGDNCQRGISFAFLAKSTVFSLPQQKVQSNHQQCFHRHHYHRHVHSV